MAMSGPLSGIIRAVMPRAANSQERTNNTTQPSRQQTIENLSGPQALEALKSLSTLESDISTRVTANVTEQIKEAASTKQNKQNLESNKFWMPNDKKSIYHDNKSSSVTEELATKKSSHGLACHRQGICGLYRCAGQISEYNRGEKNANIFFAEPGVKKNPASLAVSSVDVLYRHAHAVFYPSRNPELVDLVENSAQQVKLDNGVHNISIARVPDTHKNITQNFSSVTTRITDDAQDISCPDRKIKVFSADIPHDASLENKATGLMNIAKVIAESIKTGKVYTFLIFGDQKEIVLINALAKLYACSDYKQYSADAKVKFLGDALVESLSKTGCTQSTLGEIPKMALLLEVAAVLFAAEHGLVAGESLDPSLISGRNLDFELESIHKVAHEAKLIDVDLRAQSTYEKLRLLEQKMDSIQSELETASIADLDLLLKGLEVSFGDISREDVSKMSSEHKEFFNSLRAKKQETIDKTKDRCIEQMTTAIELGFAKDDNLELRLQNTMGNGAARKMEDLRKTKDFSNELKYNKFDDRVKGKVKEVLVKVQEVLTAPGYAVDKVKSREARDELISLRDYASKDSKVMDYLKKNLSDISLTSHESSATSKKTKGSDNTLQTLNECIGKLNELQTSIYQTIEDNPASSATAKRIALKPPVPSVDVRNQATAAKSEDLIYEEIPTVQLPQAEDLARRLEIARLKKIAATAGRPPPHLEDNPPLAIIRPRAGTTAPALLPKPQAQPRTKDDVYGNAGEIAQAAPRNQGDVYGNAGEITKASTTVPPVPPKPQLAPKTEDEIYVNADEIAKANKPPVPPRPR